MNARESSGPCLSFSCNVRLPSLMVWPTPWLGKSVAVSFGPRPVDLAFDEVAASAIDRHAILWATDREQGHERP